MHISSESNLFCTPLEKAEERIVLLQAVFRNYCQDIMDDSEMYLLSWWWLNNGLESPWDIICPEFFMLRYEIFIFAWPLEASFGTLSSSMAYAGFLS